MLTSRDIHPGGLLWVDKKLYHHCGIYEGDGNIIHFSSPEGSEINAEKAVIRRSSFEEFRKGCTVKVIEIEGSFPPDKTVHLARSQINTNGFYMQNLR